MVVEFGELPVEQRPTLSKFVHLVPEHDAAVRVRGLLELPLEFEVVMRVGVPAGLAPVDLPQ